MYAGAARIYLCHCILHHLLVRHVALVAYKQLVDSLGGISVDLLEPLLYVVERVHIGNIVDDADTVRSSIVRRCDGPKAFLASSIPLEMIKEKSLLHIRHPSTHNLQLHRLAIELDCSDFLGLSVAMDPSFPRPRGELTKSTPIVEM